MTLLKLCFFILFFSNTPLQAYTFSVASSLGATSYNNTFYLEKNNNNKYKKSLQGPLFSPNFNVSLDLSVSKRWRVGLSGNFRSSINFKSHEASLSKETKASISSSLKTSSASLYILYDLPLDLKHIGFFGFSLGYSKNFLGQWKLNLKDELGNSYEQISHSNETDNFVFNLIVGRSYEISSGIYVELIFSFSPIEWVSTSKETKFDQIPEEEKGTWNLKPSYSTALRPLDIRISLRKSFSF